MDMYLNFVQAMIAAWCNIFAVQTKPYPEQTPLQTAAATLCVVREKAASFDIELYHGDSHRFTYEVRYIKMEPKAADGRGE